MKQSKRRCTLEYDLRLSAFFGITPMLLFSSVGSNQFLNLIVVANEEENQFCRCGDEYECQSIIQTNPALKNRFREATNPDS
jgi:hypothetical protein